MVRSAYESAILLDTSAFIAVTDPEDSLHEAARAYFDAHGSLQWFALNVTTHETYTRSRYDTGFQAASERYNSMRQRFLLLDFSAIDEAEAFKILEKYEEHEISFHDALCAAVMLRHGIYKVFTLDRDFWILGFEVVPGITR